MRTFIYVCVCVCVRVSVCAVFKTRRGRHSLNKFSVTPLVITIVKGKLYLLFPLFTYLVTYLLIYLFTYLFIYVFIYLIIKQLHVHSNTSS